MLNLLFGTVWYKAQQAVDCAPAQGADKFKCNNTPGGIQSIISIVFINRRDIGLEGRARLMVAVPPLSPSLRALLLLSAFLFR